MAIIYRLVRDERKNSPYKGKYQKLADSHRVRLAGIGSLMVGLNGQPCSDPTKYDASYVTGLHLCFKPEKELRLTDAEITPLPP